MTLLSSQPNYGLPGQISTTKPWYADTCRYASLTQEEIYTLDLNPIAASIVANAQFVLLINGSPVTVTYQAGGGNAVQSLTSQLASAISRYGYFWATIQSAGIVRLVNRTKGVTVPIVRSTGLTGATLTTVQNAVVQTTLIAGSLVFYTNDLAVADGHRTVALYDYAALTPGFNALRDCAGIVMRSPSNYTTIDEVAGDYVEVVRQGLIWVRNYGSTPMNRSSLVRVKTGAFDQAIPWGTFGSGLDLATVGFSSRDIAWDSLTPAGDVGRIRLHLN